MNRITCGEVSHVLLYICQANEVYFFNTALYLWLLRALNREKIKIDILLYLGVTPSCTLAANCSTKHTATHIIWNS